MLRVAEYSLGQQAQAKANRWIAHSEKACQLAAAILNLATAISYT